MKYILKVDPEDEYYEPIWGIVSTLQFYQICFVLSKTLNVEFTHQNVSSKAIKCIKLIDENELVLFEKFIWYDDENDWMIEIIENKKTVSRLIDSSGASLFENQEFQKTIVLLKEWKHVDYIIKVQGEIPFFNIAKIRNAEGIQMVIEESIENFVEYDKIL